MASDENSPVVLAIFVSRFEAITLASMLRHYGIPSWIDGEAHASVEYISLTLGGHRLRVMREDYEAASDIIREAGLPDTDYQVKRPAKSLLKFLVFVFGLQFAIIAPTVLTGGASAIALLFAPFSLFPFPLDPKGRPDYFLSAPIVPQN